MTRTDLNLLRRWIAARVRITLRVPRATFFTFIFPLMFLLIFSALNGNAMVDAPGGSGGKVPFAQFYTPSIGIFGLTMACYSSVIFGLTDARDRGLLKRVRFLSDWNVDLRPLACRKADVLQRAERLHQQELRQRVVRMNQHNRQGWSGTL